jgi:hypothetical protein
MIRTIAVCDGCGKEDGRGAFADDWLFRWNDGGGCADARCRDCQRTVLDRAVEAGRTALESQRFIGRESHRERSQAVLAAALPFFADELDRNPVLAGIGERNAARQLREWAEQLGVQE